MKEKISTKHYKIGEEEPVYIIAEIGSNHNGNFDLAVEMIEKAATAGVNAVKIQTFKAKNHYSKYVGKISLYKENVYELIKSLEIDRSWHEKLSKICDKKGIDFLDSPTDIEAVKIAKKINMPLMKIGSFDIVDTRLVDIISKTGSGLVFSTGMANMAEIERVIEISRKNNNNKIIALQCLSNYPAEAEFSNLQAMITIRDAFGVIVGYSDHTIGSHVVLAAVAMGAKVIEKHYTLDRNMTGPDHSFAIEPKELKSMVKQIREVESALGDGIKKGPQKCELELYKMARRSLHARIDIKKGVKIADKDIVIKRPSDGIEPLLLDVVVGRIACKNLKADEPITWDKI